MRILFLLMFSLGISAGMSAIPAIARFSKAPVAGDSTKEEFSSREYLKYDKNGNLKRRETVFYKKDGSEYQTVTETFRKNGTKRDCLVMSPANILQLTKYNRKGSMKFERNYYYSGPFLESVETRRANGKINIWTEPPPEIYDGYCKAYASAKNESSINVANPVKP